MARYCSILVVLACACQPKTPVVVTPTDAELAQRPWKSPAASGYNYSPEVLMDEDPLGADLGLAAGDVADSTIERLLAHRLVLPDQFGVGVLHLPGAGARRWYQSEGATNVTQALSDSVTAALRQSERVARAVALPRLLVGERPTIAGLREGAARVQVQLLVVYRPNCRLFERAPVVGVPQYRAECTIEATVLDTRSGVLPFTTIVTRSEITTRIREDFELDGTWLRVQRLALIAAGIESAARIRHYLTTVPTSGD